MTGFESGKYSSFEEAFEGGRRYEIEKEQEAKNNDDGDGGSGLTMEQVQAMSAEQHIARKDEVDAFLQEQAQ